MIKIKMENKKLIAEYTPESNDCQWILDKIEKQKSYKLKNTFKIFSKTVLRYDEMIGTLSFIIGEICNNYIKLNRNVFDLKNDIYFDKNLKLNIKHFISYRNISIIYHLSNVIKNDIYIDDDNNFNEEVNHIPFSEFQKLVQTFPNSIETEKYVGSRISVIFSEYFNGLEKNIKKYEQYLSNKEKMLKLKQNDVYVKTLKHDLLSNSLSILENMLNNYKAYSEPIWQEKIKDILCVLFPKYIFAVREVDFGEINGFNKHPDFTLIDSNGYIDVMEIKKPAEKQIIRDATDRNNFVPQKQFTDVVVQISKYISVLNKNTDKAKENIIKKFDKDFPSHGLKKDNLFINNPKGIILLGRSNLLTEEQMYDFELIRRQYKDIVEIMTYDDLKFRLKNLIKSLE